MYYTFRQNYKSILSVLAFAVFCILVGLYADAVFDIPMGNMKHAEKLEQKGRFKEAAESRELAAEFYEFVSIPQHEDDLEYYTQKGDERKVKKTREMLRKFRKWLKECRAKAKEDREKAGSTPEEIESYREKIRTRLIASAKLYPGFISVNGNQVVNLEKNGKFSDDFIKAAETRERIARLYEKISVRYCLREAEVLGQSGKPTRAEEFRKLAAEFQEKIQLNRQKAQEDRAKAEELKKFDDMEYLLAALNDDDIQLRLRVVEKFRKDKNIKGLHRALANDNARVRKASLQVLLEKWNIPGLLLALQDSDPEIRNIAENALNSSIFRVAPDSLIASLSHRNLEVRRLAIKQLEKLTGRRFDYIADAAEEQRQVAIEKWKRWFDSRLKPGLMGIYYKSRRFAKEIKVKVDDNIDFRWQAEPAPEVPKDRFSIRWLGKIRIPADGKYRFMTTSDDGVNLWIDTQRLISAWWNDKHENDTELFLKKGLHDIRLEYFDDKGDALIQLYWESDNMPRQIIPAEQFVHIDLER
ncbi:MAG: PA14 domain-containing protein [Candidatus Poribacteria bacterium]